MEIGFTGSRHGITPAARNRVIVLFTMYWLPNRSLDCTLHHGDCVGADNDIFKIAKTLGFTTMAYPASDVHERWLAKTESDVVRDPAPSLERNKFIVNESDVLIASVQGFTPNAEQTRSGTWATIRYTKKKDSPIWLVDPLGQAQFIPVEAHRKTLGVHHIDWTY